MGTDPLIRSWPVPQRQPESLSKNGAEPGTSRFKFSLGPFESFPGHEVRQFITVPPDATWAEVVFSAGQHDGTKVFYADFMQRLRNVRTDDLHHRSVLMLPAGGLKVTSFTVVPGAVLELAVAQYWSSLGRATLTVEIDFHGGGWRGGAQALDLVSNCVEGKRQLVLNLKLKEETGCAKSGPPSPGRWAEERLSPSCH